ncbi:acyltransferase family protein [Clostridium sp. DJ247]|uniref:acyltransferase family protein n=1 Tax=Clostridium sp. DJ247 TaxID=2726188 RepID=UPI001628628B|nr:acyltransferase [Clostridium sp. DJ247]MBC2580572.1 acyltransferase [Clostridium sp. DJ247]
MEIPRKKAYLNNISLLRVFAILIVVLGHSMIVYQYKWGIYTPVVKSSFFNALKTYIDTFQMPLFIFISGYVYYYSRKECGKYNNSIEFLVSKVKRLLVPYMCIALIYVLPIRMFTSYKGYYGNNVFEIIYKYFITGLDVGHLWYLLAIFEIFIVFYLFESIINKIGIPISFVIIACANIISFKFPNIFQISSLIHYFMFFYLGYIVRKCELIFTNKLKEKNKIYLTVTLFILQILFLFIYLKFHNTSIISTLFKNIIYLLSNISGTLFYFLFLSLITFKHKSLNSNKVLKYLDRESFSIYLFHSPLIYIILKYTANKSISPFLVVPSIFIIILSVSLIISYIINKTKVLRFMISNPINKKNSMKI